VHESVMVEEVIDYLILDNNGRYVDCTFGMGGHTHEILKNLSSKASLFAIDRDPFSSDIAKSLSKKDSRVIAINDNFSELSRYIKSSSINGVLLDLGISSYQLDSEKRGFSFQNNGPLDMRMNQNQGISASEWVNIATQKEIDNILWTLGEERFSRKIAKAICISRAKKSIKTTKDLSDLISEIIPRRGRRHPATNSFRAIRMFINNELEVLRVGLEAAASILLPGARLLTISFHSMEDRIVKRFIQGKDRLSSEIQFRLVGGKPIKPKSPEVNRNPRSRSAILRVAERVA